MDDVDDDIVWIMWMICSNPKKDKQGKDKKIVIPAMFLGGVLYAILWTLFGSETIHG